MLSSGLVINNHKHDNVHTLQLNNNRSSVLPTFAPLSCSTISQIYYLTRII